MKLLGKINRKFYLTGILIGCVLLSVIIEVKINYHQSTLLRQQVESDYLALIALFDESHPGRGLQDYSGSNNDDYAKSYAVFLSAEVNRAMVVKPFHLSDAAINAGNWLIENKDLNENNIVGWELPVAWDAYNDGTTNPAGTEYTITSAIVIDALLDWYENDPAAPKAKILQTVRSAIEPFIDGSFQTKSGFIPYSFFFLINNMILIIRQYT